MTSTAIDIDFRTSGNSNGYTSDGFSFPEPHGTWTDGESATLIVPRPVNYHHLELDIWLFPYLAGGRLPSQRLSVSANGQDIFSGRFSGPSCIRVRLPVAVLAASNFVSLSFLLPDARRPADDGVPDDTRLLGFSFQFLKLLQLQMPTEQDREQNEAGPVLHIEGPGQLANQMIKYLVARNLASRVPGLRISGLSMPDWGIEFPDIPSSGNEIVIADPFHFNFNDIADRLNTGLVERVVYRGYGQRLENFPTEDHAALFPSRVNDVEAYGSDTLVIHVRGADIVDAAHPDYPLLPVNFYLDVVQSTGLRPVFLGQLDPNPYTDDLRAAFPDAVFLPPQDRMRDFETMRRAKNILTAVSTFSWIAAWLSAAEQILIPVNGLFHPMQAPGVDLLPTEDRRFRFFLFPINHAVKVPEHRARHAALDGLWREITGAMLHDIRRGARLYPRRIEDHLPIFDAEFYTSAHPSVRASIDAGTDDSALDHFMRFGFAAGLQAANVDMDWYVSTYLMAALEIGQGDYRNAEDHFAAIGRQRGYTPRPAVRH